MNVKDMIKETVEGAVREVPAGFADGAIRRGRRHQRMARAAATGGAIFAVTAVAFTVVDPADLRGDTLPAASQGGELADGVIDFDRLDRGPSPGVPWYEDGVLRFGDSSTPFELRSALRPDSPALTRVQDGYVVWELAPEDAGGHAILSLVPDGGSPIKLASGSGIGIPVVSASGERVAWGVRNDDWESEADARDLTSVMVVADARTGAVLYELTDAPSPHAAPQGFIGEDRVLFGTGANTAWDVYTWELGGGVEPYRDDTAVNAVSPTGDLAGLTSPTGGTDVVDVATGEVLWTHPDDIISVAFSPDSRYVAAMEAPIPTWLTPEDLAGAEPGEVITRDMHSITVTQELLDTSGRYPDGWAHVDQVVIRDAHTGDEVRQLETEAPESPLRWESDTSLVFGAYQDSAEAALVRCPVDGECELATEPRDLDDDPNTFDNPYVMGR